MARSYRGVLFRTRRRMLALGQRRWLERPVDGSAERSNVLARAVMMMQ